MKESEKAKKLIDKFYKQTSGWTKQTAWKRAKLCALISIEENIELLKKMNEIVNHEHWGGEYERLIKEQFLIGVKIKES